jgi:hypothetical protein
MQWQRQRLQMYAGWFHACCNEPHCTCHALFALLEVVVLMVGAHGPRCFSPGHFDTSRWALDKFELQLYFDLG